MNADDKDLLRSLEHLRDDVSPLIAVEILEAPRTSLGGLSVKEYLDGGGTPQKAKQVIDSALVIDAMKRLQRRSTGTTV